MRRPVSAELLGLRLEESGFSLCHFIIEAVITFTRSSCLTYVSKLRNPASYPQAHSVDFTEFLPLAHNEDSLRIKDMPQSPVCVRHSCHHIC